MRVAVFSIPGSHLETHVVEGVLPKKLSSTQTAFSEYFHKQVCFRWDSTLGDTPARPPTGHPLVLFGINEKLSKMALSFQMPPQVGLTF